MTAKTNRTKTGFSFLCLSLAAFFYANCIGFALPLEQELQLRRTAGDSNCGAETPVCLLFFGGSSSGDGSSQTTGESSSLIQPRISITRDTGAVPFHVYVSAKDSTAVDTDYPYEELEYNWDFGDDDPATMVHPVTGADVRPVRDQTGPEASYVFRQPGTYEIVLTARKTINGELVSESERRTVTVEEWAGESRYFDPASGDDTDDGLSPAGAWRSAAKLSDWLNGGDDRRAYLKRGTVMDVDAVLNVESSNIRVAAYGTGAKPVLRANAIMDVMLRLSTRDRIADQVYSDIVLNGNNGTARTLVTAVMLQNGALLEGLAFIDAEFVNDDGTNLVSLVNFLGWIKDVLFWNPTFERNSSEDQGIYAEMREHFAVVGGSFSGGEGHEIRDHPIYPNEIDHSLYRWIDFQSTVNNNFSINNNTKNGRTLNYLLVDGCDVTGGKNGLDFSATSADSWFDHVIVQNNAIHDLGHRAQGYGIIGEAVKRITIRNNRFYANPWEDLLIMDHAGETVTINAQNNIFYKSALDLGPVFDFRPGHRITLTDNILVHEGTPGGSRNLGMVNLPAREEWVLDRNQYWAPNLPTPYKRSGAGNMTFAEWQAHGFEPNGTYADPGFIDPANGRF